MALNNSGPISLRGTTAGQSIQQELGSSGQISLLDSAVRSLAGVPTGAVTMPTNFYGKSSTVIINLANATYTNLNLYTQVGSPSAAGSYRVVIQSSTIIGGTSTATPALTIGAWKANQTLEILVQAGAQIIGAYPAGGPFNGVGLAGGNAIDGNGCLAPVTINNFGSILGAGGGGGGGGLGGTASYTNYTASSYSNFLWGVFSTSGTPGSWNLIQINWKGITVYNPTGQIIPGPGADGVTSLSGTDGRTYTRSTLFYDGTPFGDPQKWYGVTRSGVSDFEGGFGGAGGAGIGYGNTNNALGRGSGSVSGWQAQGAGNGGAGGLGGNYGTAGSTGNTGATSSTGGVGFVGYAGGAAGKSVIKNGATITVNNSGTLAGPII